MIDLDLSHELHTLAATLDEPFDLAALHRRISLQSRRRAAVKVGFAGAGVAAVVGGLFIVQERPGPADSGVAAGSPVASQPSQVEATALPSCDVALAELRAAQSTPDSVVAKDIPADTSASTADLPTADFKGPVTILTVDGQGLTFRSDDPNHAAPSDGVATLDAATRWFDGPTPIDITPALQVGEQVGLATTLSSDGVEHVIFIDVSTSAPAAGAVPAPDGKLAIAESSTAESAIVLPGPSLPDGPTAKSAGTITGVGASSISVTLDEASGQTGAIDIDLSTTMFYAGNTQCTPGSLTIGTAVGVAYHLDDVGNLIADATMLIP